jgi:hypothetical protein
MITATYRSLSSRLHEHVKASGVIKEGVVYIGEGVGGSCYTVTLCNGAQTTITLASGEKLAEKIKMVHKRFGKE